MKEYNDCLERAQRLSAARESYLSKTTGAVNTIKLDDIMIYLRWLVCQLHASKKFTHYMKVTEFEKKILSCNSNHRVCLLVSYSCTVSVSVSSVCGWVLVYV